MNNKAIMEGDLLPLMHMEIIGRDPRKYYEDLDVLYPTGPQCGDTEKAPGMLGPLVTQLPALHMGGALRDRHEDIRKAADGGRPAPDSIRKVPVLALKWSRTTVKKNAYTAVHFTRTTTAKISRSARGCPKPYVRNRLRTYFTSGHAHPTAATTKCWGS